MSSRLREILRLLHRVEDSPRKTALAFGLGVWIAFFPVLGTHTALALGLAHLFRLSRLAVLLGAFVNNPWTIGPLYLGGTLLGCALLGVSPEQPIAQDWGRNGPLWQTALAPLRAYLWPFVVGNTVMGLVGGGAGYAGVRRLLGTRRETPACGARSVPPGSIALDGGPAPSRPRASTRLTRPLAGP